MTARKKALRQAIDRDERLRRVQLGGGDPLFQLARAEPTQLELLRPAEVELHIDVAKSLVCNLTTKEQWKLKPLGEVAPILEAGGVFPYAQKVGMLKA